jgi:hypothetical protein
MASPRLFSGPPSNKATAGTVAVALATLFWTIAAHTWWKSISSADLTLYESTSTIIFTAILTYLIPESAAYTQHNQQRQLDRQAANDSITISSAIQSAIKTQVQAQQKQAAQSGAVGGQVGDGLTSAAGTGADSGVPR